MYISLFILIPVIWLVWGVIEALIRRARFSNVLLNFITNREKAILYANGLNENMRQYEDQRDRITLLEAELPHLWVLTTGYPIATTKRWLARKSVRGAIEELERAMYDNPSYLGRSLGELNKALNLPAVGSAPLPSPLVNSRQNLPEEKLVFPSEIVVSSDTIDWARIKERHQQYITGQWRNH